jgi:hypothetical protein
MLRVIYGPIQENTLWSIQCNIASSSCFKVLTVVTYKTQRKGMGWTIAVRLDREMGGWVDGRMDGFMVEEHQENLLRRKNIRQAKS